MTPKAKREAETDEARLGKEEGRRLAVEVLAILKRAYKYDGFISMQIKNEDYAELKHVCNRRAGGVKRDA